MELREAAEFFFVILVFWYPIYIFPAGVGWLIVWFFGKSRIHINIWDLGLLVIPWIVWVGLTAINSSNKSLANGIEAMYVGICVPLALLIRVIKGPDVNQVFIARILLLSVCGVAVVLWVFMPSLPE